jgi:DUF1009 family protein
MSEAIGLIAGGGTLPLVLGRALRAKGFRVVGLQVAGDPADGLVELCDPHLKVDVGDPMRALEVLQSAGVTSVQFAGKVDAVRAVDSPLDPLARQLLGADGERTVTAVAERIVGFLTIAGLKVLSQTAYCPELVAPEGAIAGPAPTEEIERRLLRAFAVARSVAALNIGQAAAVRDGLVLAVEAAEGTDAMIARAGTFGPGSAIAKVAWANQDPRFDLPTVGPETLRVMAAAGADALAVQSLQTLLLDRQRFEEDAARLGITVIGVRDAAF